MAKVNSWVDQVKDFQTKEEEKTSIFQQFTQTATVHGLRHTSDGHRGTFRRGFWLLAFLGMLSGLLYTVFSQVVVMMGYPSVTQQRVEFKGGLPFPAVTLCNLNQFRKSAVGDDKALSLLQVAMSDLGAFAPSINWSDPVWDVDEEESGDVEDYLEYITHPIRHTLHLCSWDNEPFDCWKEFKVQKTDFGMCYTFNGREYNSTPRQSIHSGSKYGLTIVADVMQDEYMLGSDSDVAGLRVLLHDPDETPLVEGRGFDVGPGNAIKMSLKYRQVNYLPPPYMMPYGLQCTNTSVGEFKNFLKLYDRYDISACMAECRYNYIVNACGCRGIFDRGNATVCHARQLLECYKPTFNTFMADNLGWICGCPIPCRWNLFDADLSMGYYPSSAFVEQIQKVVNPNLTQAYLRHNLLKLTLAYDYFLMESIDQVPQFDFESIMSTFGGQLGIFIGASLLSLLEFLEFGLELFFFKLLRIGNKLKHKS